MGLPRIRDPSSANTREHDAESEEQQNPRPEEWNHAGFAERRRSAISMQRPKVNFFAHTVRGIFGVAAELRGRDYGQDGRRWKARELIVPSHWEGKS